MESSASFVIAIDGPAASGKSSVSRLLGQRLGCLAVNSGELYRAATWAVLEAGVDPGDAEAAGALVEELEIVAKPADGTIALSVNGRDPSSHYRDSVVAANVSTVAQIPAVRARLTAILRGMGEGRNLVMEGRDIGSVVFPETPYKFYIDASEEVRARRRQAQGETDAPLARDAQDATRKTAPLRIVNGACVIDTTHMTLDEVLAAVLRRLQEQGLAVPPAP